MNRSSTANSSFYPSETSDHHQLNYYQYDQNLTYVQQLEHDLKLTKEQLNATMKSIKTFWSPELKKERNLRKDEACRYQLLTNDHQKRSKQVKRNPKGRSFCFIGSFLGQSNSIT